MDLGKPPLSKVLNQVMRNQDQYSKNLETLGLYAYALYHVTEGAEANRI